MKRLLLVPAVLMLFAAMPVRDGATIENSGSTNVHGWSVKVWSDGTVAGGTGPVPAELAARFFSDLRTAKATPPSPPEGCLKSASFGTATTVAYHGWRSPDLQCPVPAGIVPLQRDVQAIVRTLQIRLRPRHGQTP